MTYADLTPEEKKYYDLYKSNDHSFAYRLNDALRLSRGIEEFESAIKILDALTIKDAFDVDVPLFRATFDRIVVPFIANDCYKNPDYLSTGLTELSVQKHFTESEDPVLIRFIGLNGLQYCPLEKNTSFDADENEVLIGRDNLFEVMENTTITDKKQIVGIMGKFRSLDVEKLKIYSFKWKSAAK
jgi:hypothetical protein